MEDPSGANKTLLATAGGQATVGAYDNDPQP